MDNTWAIVVLCCESRLLHLFACTSSCHHACECVAPCYNCSSALPSACITIERGCAYSSMIFGSIELTHLCMQVSTIISIRKLPIDALNMACSYRFRLPLPSCVRRVVDSWVFLLISKLISEFTAQVIHSRSHFAHRPSTLQDVSLPKQTFWSCVLREVPGSVQNDWCAGRLYIFFLRRQRCSH